MPATYKCSTCGSFWTNAGEYVGPNGKLRRAVQNENERHNPGYPDDVSEARREGRSLYPKERS